MQSDTASAGKNGRAQARVLADLVAALPLIIFALVLAWISYQAPHFLRPDNLAMILTQSLPVVVLSIGLAAVVMGGGDDVVAGGIDLSIPATTVLCAGIIAQMLSTGQPLWLAVLAALIAAGLVGVINAFLVNRIGMTPLLATLAMMVAVVGASKLVTQSRRIDLNHPMVLWLRDGKVAGVPVGVILVSLITLAAFHLLHRTRWGMHLQAAGGSADAAEISGLKVKRLFSQAFVLAAFMGFLASFLLLARGSGSTPGSEENLMMEMVLATFLGATFSPRRVVSMWGAVLGAVLVTAISVGFKTIGVDVFWTGLVKGSLIVVLVALSAISMRIR